MIFFEILLLIIVILAGGSIIFTTLRIGASPMPSSRKMRHAIMCLMEDSQHRTLIDLGSGWGTMVTTLAIKFPERKIIGYEISFIPWVFSLAVKYFLQLKNLTLHHKNFLKVHLSDAALICYLLPKNMISLEKKLKQDKTTSSLLVSNTFALPSYKPLKVIRINDIYKSPIYLYEINLPGEDNES